MNLRLLSLGLAVLGGAGGLFVPSSAEAGNVGYHAPACGWYGSPAQAIVAAGHTPIYVGTLDSASLASLQGLVIYSCAYQGSSAVDAAVANGLRLMIDVQSVPATTALPGNPSLVMGLSPGSCSDSRLIPGSPINTGPGGSLSDSSLDNGNICGPMGSIRISSLPVGGQPLVGLVESSNHAVAAAYPTGQGLVALSISQWPAVLPGAFYQGPMTSSVLTYYGNTIAWMMNQPVAPSITCASEGYTGTKLSWCQNICEKGYTGATLNSWIKRWTDKYRDLPYCAREK